MNTVSKYVRMHQHVNFERDILNSVVDKWSSGKKSALSRMIASDIENRSRSLIRNQKPVNIESHIFNN